MHDDMGYAAPRPTRRATGDGSVEHVTGRGDNRQGFAPEGVARWPYRDDVGNWEYINMGNWDDPDIMPANILRGPIKLARMNRVQESDEAPSIP